MPEWVFGSAERRSPPELRLGTVALPPSAVYEVPAAEPCCRAVSELFRPSELWIGRNESFRMSAALAAGEAQSALPCARQSGMGVGAGSEVVSSRTGGVDDSREPMTTPSVLVVEKTNA